MSSYSAIGPTAPTAVDSEWHDGRLPLISRADRKFAAELTAALTWFLLIKTGMAHLSFEIECPCNFASLAFDSIPSL